MALGSDYDITYHTGTAVKTIIIESGAAVGIQLEDGKEVRADIVVSNADLEFTETRLLPEKYQSFPAAYWRNRQPGPSALLVSL